MVKKYSCSEVQLPCIKVTDSEINTTEPEAIDWELQRVPLQKRTEESSPPVAFYNPGMRPGIYNLPLLILFYLVFTYYNRNTSFQ